MIPYLAGDDMGAIVADFGHHTTKMGFAGEDSPRAWFRSVRLRYKYVGPCEATLFNESI